LWPACFPLWPPREPTSSPDFAKLDDPCLLESQSHLLMKTLSIAILLVVTGELAAPAEDAHPNIIVMLADDMGMGDTSAYQDFTGNSDEDQIHTPSMERLARMGVRFTDAHTPSSRCSPTRYALLTGRYPWRNRLKHWVLFGSQGDPMIEADRPTLATMLRDNGYYTAMVGKWHVGLRYRRSDGKPAAGWDDADLTQPLFDGPLDHGFDDCQFTSRSHGTSGPFRGGRKPNIPKQNVGPGHISGRTAIAATKNAKQLIADGPQAYVLEELGGRHSDNAMHYMQSHVSGAESKNKPFFLYYASNSNHGPHTPDSHVGDQLVAGAAKNVAGQPINTRGDYVYENDVALGRMLDWLEQTDDPRNSGKKLIETTIVIFTSDNGAEIDTTAATGPFRSNKGSAYEGGHRVPFLVSWPTGDVGDGNAKTPGNDSPELIGLHDLFATFSEVVGDDLPELAAGDKGAEDSVSILSALSGNELPSRPMFYHDHKQAKDGAASAIRIDNPSINGRTFNGKWKLFFDASLLRLGEARPVELFDLHTDPQEEHDRLGDESLKPLVKHLIQLTLLHRTSGGHRFAKIAAEKQIAFDWRKKGPQKLRGGVAANQLAAKFDGHSAEELTTEVDGLSMTMRGAKGSSSISGAVFNSNERGLGLSSGKVKQVDDGEALLISFDEDVIVESAAIVAGNGICGGYYGVGDHAPLAIYCVDADIDAKDQSGLLSDIGVLKKGQTLRLDSSPHFGTESPGQWRLGALTVRRLQK
jgi:arylsulfatase A